jgi:hypothetical protein
MPPSNKIANANAVNAPGFGLPLSTLLSQALVAFTIEFDNEFEHQMPHRTTSHGRTPGSPQTPWLVSLVMWSNCMQFVGKKGISVGDLETLSRTKTNLNGMERWGYIVVATAPIDSRPKRPRSDWLIRATPAGRKAQDVWGPMVGAIEKRWLERFGKEIGHLRDSLAILIRQMDLDLPDCLPILGYGLFSAVSDPARRKPTARKDNVGSRRPLPALLSKALLAFAIEFERESDLSLAISANLLRVLGEKGVRVRDLPLVAGVSREAISVSMGILRKKGIVVVEPEPGGKGKLIRLTPTGLDAQGRTANC